MPFFPRLWKEEGKKEEEREKINFYSCSVHVRGVWTRGWRCCLGNFVAAAEVMGFAPNAKMMICPFDGKNNEFKLQRAYKGKWLDVLFKLVDANQISIAEVAQIEGLSMDEANDLLESWKWFKNYEKAKEGV